MNKKKSIRTEVVDILNELFGDIEKGVIFPTEKTTKRSGGGRKISKNELKTSTSWSAFSEGTSSVCVSCVGLTMAEFIKEYKNNNCLFTTSKQRSLQFITIYKNKPEWKANGHVKSFDLEKQEIILYIGDLILVDDVTAKITKKTPEWLLNSPPERLASFTCKIHQGWRELKSFDDYDWDEIWKTFRLIEYLSKEEMMNYF
jgi:hypothetical protein